MNHTSLTTTHQVLAVAFSLACPLVFAGTDGYITTSTAAGYSDVGPAAMYAGQSGEQSGINMRESARRIAERDAALQLLQEGRTAYQDGKYRRGIGSHMLRRRVSCRSSFARAYRMHP